MIHWLHSSDRCLCSFMGLYNLPSIWCHMITYMGKYSFSRSFLHTPQVLWPQCHEKKGPAIGRIVPEDIDHPFFSSHASSESPAPYLPVPVQLRWFAPQPHVSHPSFKWSIQFLDWGLSISHWSTSIGYIFE